jgi:hypothetical protein
LREREYTEKKQEIKNPCKSVQSVAKEKASARLHGLSRIEKIKNPRNPALSSSAVNRDGKILATN